MKHTAMFLLAALASAAFAELPSPVVKWRMDALDSEGRVPDATGGGNHLKIGSGCSVVDDRSFGKALSFDGNMDAWGLSLNAMAFEGSRTISVWLRREADEGPLDPSVNKIPYLLCRMSGASVNYQNGSTTYLMCPKLNVSSVVAMKANRLEWHHLVFVFEKGTDPQNWTMRSYLDGVEKTVTNGQYEVSTYSEAVYVGNSDIYGRGSRPFYGRMSRLALYDCALDADQISEIFLGDVAELPVALLGQWPMTDIDVSDDGVRTVRPIGDSLVTMNAAADVSIVPDGVGGTVAEVPNTSASCLQISLPNAMSGMSFGMWVNFSTNMAAFPDENDNKFPQVYKVDGYYGRMCVNGSMLNAESCIAHVYDVQSFNDEHDQGFNCQATMQKGRWSHLGVTYEMRKDEDSGIYGVQPRIYVDGTLVSTGRWKTASALTGVYPSGTRVSFGNGGMVANRALGGRLDEICFFQGVLNDAEMQELANGLPSVSAGDDFRVAKPTAKLAGEIGTTGSFGNRKSAAVTAKWSVVSTPEGGDAVSFVDSANPRTSVLLPVVGEYVLRLTIADSLGRTAEDEVTVERVAEVEGNAAPVVSVSGDASALTAIPVSLAAAAFDPDGDMEGVRISWRAVSGPDAVRFEPTTGPKVSATFAAEGTYGIVAIASDGISETVSEPFTVAVSSSDAIDLERGLIGYWPFEVGDTNFATGVKYEVDRSSVTFEKGVDGFGIRANGAFYPYFDPKTTLLEEADPDLDNTPIERYRAFSCWIYHDTSDTNNSYCASIIAVPYTLGLWYNCEGGANGFTMYQQSIKDWNGGNGNIDVYGRPEKDPADRWTHVYALFDRRTNWVNSTSQLWIDGVRQTNRTTHGMGGGRAVVPNGGNMTIGGHVNNGVERNNGHFKDADGNWLSRTFPGIIDEVRMYNRALSEAEIRYLANNPVVKALHPPAIGGEPASFPAVSRKESKAIDVKVALDAYPEPTDVTYSWRVISGDASNVAFSSPTERETEVFVRHAGTYAVQLAVTANGRTVYSEPIPLEVSPQGLVVKLR